MGDDSLDEKTTITNSHRHIPVYDPSYPVPQPTPFKEDEPEKKDDSDTKPEDVTPNPAEDIETKDVWRHLSEARFRQVLFPLPEKIIVFRSGC